MAQKILNYGQILSGLKRSSGEGVPEGMGGERLPYAGQLQAVAEDAAHSVGGDRQDAIARCSVVAGEERELIESPSSGFIRAGIEIYLGSPPSLVVEVHNPLPTSFAHNPG